MWEAHLPLCGGPLPLLEHQCQPSLAMDSAQMWPVRPDVPPAPAPGWAWLPPQPMRALESISKRAKADGTGRPTHRPHLIDGGAEAPTPAAPSPREELWCVCPSLGPQCRRPRFLPPCPALSDLTDSSWSVPEESTWQLGPSRASRTLLWDVTKLSPRTGSAVTQFGNPGLNRRGSRASRSHL